MKRRICWHVAVVDGAGRAFHDGLQAWVAGKEQRTHLGDASSFIHCQYFIILPGDFAERGKIAYMNLHRINIAYLRSRYETRPGTICSRRVVFRILTIHFLTTMFQVNDTPLQTYWSGNAQSTLDWEPRQSRASSTFQVGRSRQSCTSSRAANPG